ncbi:hypothetical protein ABZ471_25985 [Streptomyces sp. NPDC005728]|uniref:nSTAND1 domain-containing NTPase n=1 Tax=Streptomyces sp. NPDC005728 TaxID=3157054 RepID=UPI0033D9D754
MFLTGRYGPEEAPDQILVVATGQHAPGSRLPDVPAATASARALGRAFAAADSGTERHVRVVLDPADLAELGEAIAGAAERARGLLLVHFVGHGILGPGGDLYLATCATDNSRATRLAHSALPCAMLGNYLLSSRATARAVVLDCCFSAHSFTRLGGTRTYVLASASEDFLAPSGTVLTPFTGAVLDTLSVTSAGGASRVTLDDLYREVAVRMAHQGRSGPRRLGADAVGDTVIAERRRESGSSAPDPCATAPYPGLAAFEVGQSAFFHGRHRELTELLFLLTDRARHARPLALAAPSGAGKSSLLRAGMLAALAADQVPVPGMSDWPVALLQPGSRPAAALTRGLATALEAPEEMVGASGPALAEQVRRLLRRQQTPGEARRLLIVVDQFEQVFTAEPAEREAFLTGLEALWRPNGAEPPPAVLVYAVKLDFYGAAMSLPQVTDPAAPEPLLLGPLHQRQIEQMVTGPAHRAGLRVDDGLVALLHQDLAELSGGSVVEAEVLPLAAHALQRTYEHGDGRSMTVADYLVVGGAPKALAGTAATVFASLDAAAQDALRSLLPLFVQIGEEVPDTACQVAEARLLAEAADPEAARRALESFAEAGLMRATGPTRGYELAHETLLRHWPEMRNAVTGCRERRAVEQRIRMDAQTWSDAGRDPGLLYRGVRLDMAAERARSAGPAADPVAVTFVEEGLRLRREEGRQAGRQRRQRLAMIALVMLLVVAAPLGVVLLRQNQHLTVAGESQELAEAAGKLRTRQQADAMQVGLAAWQKSRTPAGRSALLNAAGTPPVVPAAEHDGPVYTAAINKQHLLATAGQDRKVRLTDISDPFSPRPVGDPLTGPVDEILDVTFSPDGRTLLAAERNGTVWRWDVTRPQAPQRLAYIPSPRGVDEGPDEAHAVAFSHDGSRLAVGYESGSTLLYAPRTLRRVGELHGTPDAWVSAVAWSRDGKLLATGYGRDPKPGTVQFWKVEAGKEPVRDGPEHGGPLSSVTSLTFSADGAQLLGTSTDGRLATRFWRVAERRTASRGEVILQGPEGMAWKVVNVAKRPLIAVSGVDRTVRLLNSSTFQPVFTLSGPTPVTALAAAEDGSSVVAAYYDGVVRVWPLDSTIMLGPGYTMQTVSTAPDRRLAVTSNTATGLALWDVADPRRPIFRAALPPPPGGAQVAQSVAFSAKKPIVVASLGKGWVAVWSIADTRHPQLVGTPLHVTSDGAMATSVALSSDGTLMAAGTTDRTIHVWNISDPKRPLPLGDSLTTTGNVQGVAFSPDGRTLAAAALDGQVTFWDTSGAKQPTSLTRPRTASAAGANALAYSPEGDVLAVSCGDGSVRLWDVKDPREPRALAPLRAAAGSVYSLSFDPHPERGEQVLSTAHADGTIRLWDLPPSGTAHVSATLSAGTAAVKAVAFTNDGKTLLSVDWAGTGVSWFTDPEQAEDYVCAVSGPPLSEAQWRADVPSAPYAVPCR